MSVGDGRMRFASVSQPYPKNRQKRRSDDLLTSNILEPNEELVHLHLSPVHDAVFAQMHTLEQAQAIVELIHDYVMIHHRYLTMLRTSQMYQLNFILLQSGYVGHSTISVTLYYQFCDPRSVSISLTSYIFDIVLNLNIVKHRGIMYTTSCLQGSVTHYTHIDVTFWLCVCD